MSLLRTIPSIAAACGLTLFAVASVSAQNAPAPAAPPAGPHHPGQFREHMEHRRAERLKLLHDALAIRPDQEAAWQAFVAATTPKPGERHWGGQGAPGAQGAQGEHHHLTTPERLDRIAARIAERQARFQQHAAAVKAFYAALSPTQQRTFDALAALRGHGGRGGGWGHGGGHWGHGWGKPGGMGGPAPGAPSVGGQ